MSDLSDIIRILPPMKSGNELLSALKVLPEYNSFICDADASVRLMALSDLYRIYVPNGKFYIVNGQSDHAGPAVFHAGLGHIKKPRGANP